MAFTLLDAYDFGQNTLGPNRALLPFKNYFLTEIATAYDKNHDEHPVLDFVFLCFGVFDLD